MVVLEYQADKKAFMATFHQKNYDMSDLLKMCATLDMDFLKFIINDPTIQQKIKEQSSNYIIELATHIAVDATLFNTFVQLFGQSDFTQMVQEANPSHRDCISAYLISENTVGVQSWMSPQFKASHDDIETLYLSVASRMSSNTDIKSLLFLSATALGKDLITANFASLSLSNKDPFLVFQLIKSLTAFPKVLSEQDVQLAQMRLVSMGVDAQVASNEEFKSDDTKEQALERITKLIPHDLLHLLKLDDLDLLDQLTTPVKTRPLLIQQGILKRLASHQGDKAAYCYAKLLTSVHPHSIRDITRYVPICYRLCQPAVPYQYQMQGLMALTNIASLQEEEVLMSIYSKCPQAFVGFIMGYVTHDETVLRRVGMELHVNMMQSPLFMHYVTEPEAAKLVFLLCFEEDAHLQYASLAVLSGLLQIDQVADLLKERLGELKEIRQTERLRPVLKAISGE